MAKGLRSKVKRANRTIIRKEKVEPFLAKRCATLARVVQRQVVEKRDATGLMSLMKPFHQGFKSGFKKPEYDLGVDEDIRTLVPEVSKVPIAGNTKKHADGSYVANYVVDNEVDESMGQKKRGGRRPNTTKEHVWFTAPGTAVPAAEEKEKKPTAKTTKKGRAARK